MDEERTLETKDRTGLAVDLPNLQVQRVSSTDPMTGGGFHVKMTCTSGRKFLVSGTLTEKRKRKKKRAKVHR